MADSQRTVKRGEITTVFHANGCRTRYRPGELPLLIFPSKDPEHDAFCKARGYAKSRHIVWELSFEEWKEEWQKSGKRSLRGTGKDNYMMIRENLALSYRKGNLLFVRKGDNYHSRQKFVKAR